MSQKKQNIAVLIYSLAGGGAERVVSILINELQQNKTEFNKIFLVLMNTKIDYELPNNINVFFLEKSKATENGIFKLLKLPILGLKYRYFLAKNNIDVSLAFMTRPSYINIFAKIFSFGKKIKFIISERTTPSQMYRDNSFKSKINRFLIKNLYSKADKIITNSYGNNLDLIDNFSIKSSKIITIYNLFDLEKIYKNSKIKVSNQIFNQEENFNLITVGRLDSGKNHQLIISAFAKIMSDDEVTNFIKQKNKKLNLIILGSGELKLNLKEQIKKLNLEKNIFLLGFDSNPYKYMSKSDIFVFASLYEGFPNVLVEALSCQLPIISTDCKSGPREILAPNNKIIPEKLKNGINIERHGFLTDLNNLDSLFTAIKTMILNEELRTNFHKNSQKRAEDFNKNRIFESYLEIIRN
jgi:N-acetylgalactosamine-N,N'-diacetylbacillosaminyl-diphospho-undecaprenol 4-alpha-N-acetylgalactosaminyltransferase